MGHTCSGIQLLLMQTDICLHEHLLFCTREGNSTQNTLAMPKSEQATKAEGEECSMSAHTMFFCRACLSGIAVWRALAVHRRYRLVGSVRPVEMPERDESLSQG